MEEAGETGWAESVGWQLSASCVVVSFGGGSWRDVGVEVGEGVGIGGVC